MKEIVSLQLGHFSNFVGTHWWNIQETGFNYIENEVNEINHDVLYREGLNLNKEVTFTPRLLLVDLKGSLRTLPVYGELYQETETACAAWPEDKIEVINSTDSNVKKNKFHQKLENEEEIITAEISDSLNNETEVWSDYLYSRFHPRTVNVVDEYTHKNTQNPFNVYHLGKSISNSDKFSEDFCDKIRNYVEECDNLQGFHLISDVTDGFGGLSSSCLEYISDEYDKKSVLVFAPIPSVSWTDVDQNDKEKLHREETIKLINYALSVESISEHCSLLIPISTGKHGWKQPHFHRQFTHVNYNPELLYHSSAILASTLDTVTLPYRLKSSGFSLKDLCSLNVLGRKIAATTATFPLVLKENEDFIDYLDNLKDSLWEDMTPNCAVGNKNLRQFVTIRGVPETRLKRQPFQPAAARQRDLPAYEYDTVKDMLQFYLECNTFNSKSHVTNVNRSQSVKAPYPNIFSEFIDSDGNLNSLPRNKSQGVKNIAMITGCHSCDSLSETLDQLHRETNRIKIRRFPEFEASGLDYDEYKESLNNLLNLKECYD